MWTLFVVGNSNYFPEYVIVKTCKDRKELSECYKTVCYKSIDV